MKSKCFKAYLPSPSKEELDRIKLWCDDHLAWYSLVPDEGNVVVLNASREKLYTKQNMLRNIRSVLKRLGFDVKKLKRNWLTLTPSTRNDCNVDKDDSKIIEILGRPDKKHKCISVTKLDS